MNNPRRRRRGAGGVGEAAAAEAAGRGEEKGVVSDIYLAGEERAGWSSSLSESPRVQRRRQRGLDYEYDFIDDSHPPPLPKLGLRPESHPRRLLGRRKTRRSWPRAPLLPARPGAGWRGAPVTPPGSATPGARGEGGGRCARMWPETALLCAWIRVCLRGAALRRVGAWSGGAAQDAGSPEPRRSWAPALPLRAVPFPGRCRAPRGAGGAADGCRSNSV